MKTLRQMVATLKAAASSVVVRFSRSTSWGASWLATTKLDIAGRVGDGCGNSIVVACRRWVQTAWPEAPLIIQTVNGGGEWRMVADHPMTALLRRPNPYYSGIQLLHATLADRLLTGNAYWIKIRSGVGRPVQLWWVPSSLMRPMWPEDDQTVFISHYEYSANGQITSYSPKDVVHFRRGFDPANVRLGCSELRFLLGELFTDEEALAYENAMLANMGVPGVILSPDAETRPTQDQLEATKNNFMQKFGGDRRGEPMVMSGPTRVSVLSFSPEQMAVTALRRIPEERVTAALGIPAIVAGMGAGLDRSTFSNMAEAREAAYESYIIPDHRLFDADLDTQLVPDFGDPARTRVSHDYSQVRVLQDDQNALHTRAREDLLAGLITLNQGLEMIGLPPLTGPEGDARFVPGTITVTPADALLPVPGAPEVPAQGVLPAGMQDGEDMAQERARMRAFISARNKVAGPALLLSEDDLDRLSRVGSEDLSDAERFWRRAVDGTDLDDLLRATPSEEQD